MHQGGENAGVGPGLGPILGHQNATSTNTPQQPHQNSANNNVGQPATQPIDPQRRQPTSVPGSNGPQPVVSPGQGQGNRYLFTHPVDPALQFQAQPHALHQNLNMPPPAQPGPMMSQQPLGQNGMWPPQQERRYMDIPPIQQRNGFAPGIFDFSQIVNQSAAWNFGPPMGGRNANSRAVYLGNVPDTTTDEDLRELSAEFGELDSVRIVPSKHCAFLNFRDRGAAHKMIERAQLKEMKLKNKVVSVRPAKEMPSSHGQPPPQNPSKSVYLGNVPDNATEEQIRAFVDAACNDNKIAWIRVMTGKRCAFINFEDVQDATDFLAAVADAPLVLEGATLTAGWAKEKEAGSRQSSSSVSAPTRSIYVGNLASNSEESDIITLAEEHGTVQNVRLMPGKGHAFINFVAVEAAVKFMEKHEESPFTVQGVNLTCNWAKDPPVFSNHKSQHQLERQQQPQQQPQQQHQQHHSHHQRDRPKHRPKRHHMSGGHGGPNPHMSRGPSALHQPSKSIYLGNIPEDISKQEIVLYMDRYGPIESVKILETKHCSFVNFYHIHSALNFVQQANFQPIEIRGKTLSVGFAKEVKSLHNNYEQHLQRNNRPLQGSYHRDWNAVPPPHPLGQIASSPNGPPPPAGATPIEGTGVGQSAEATTVPPEGQDGNLLYETAVHAPPVGTAADGEPATTVPPS